MKTMVSSSRAAGAAQPVAERRHGQAEWHGGATR